MGLAVRGAAAGATAVTPPAHELTMVFLEACIHGNQRLYQPTPMSPTRMQTKTVSRNIPVRNPGVNCPRARERRFGLSLGIAKGAGGFGHGS